MQESIKKIKLQRINNNIVTEVEDFVINEVPVSLVYNGIPHVVMMCTPMDLDDMVYGFSYSEGVINRFEQIVSIQYQYKVQGIEAHIEIEAQCAQKLETRKRQMSARTGCGICGLDSLDQVNRVMNPVTHVPEISTEVIEHALGLAKNHQEINKITGASHAVFCCDNKGSIVAVREDVGRHVALDKLIGYLIRNKIEVSDYFCMTTSRASFEMVQKSVCINFGLLVAMSAPTYMAINLAKKSNLRLVAFSRVGRINVYSA